ncbi:hypothetical protein RSA46_19355 [Pseudomonas oryzihabitans]|nr:hypothetical protein RSA46_19355 [Pseudomonas psychrotolerans]KTT51368.1 hypothetical protein SB11R_04775 [Pseudomonas psychrotolerans]
MFLCKAEDVVEFEPIAVEVEGVGTVAVYFVNGRYRATDDECTHATASLADGMQDGEIIECPVHGGQFNILTGEAVKAPCFKRLKTYEVLEDAGSLFLKLE